MKSGLERIDNDIILARIGPVKVISGGDAADRAAAS